MIEDRHVGGRSKGMHTEEIRQSRELVTEDRSYGAIAITQAL